MPKLKTHKATAKRFKVSNPKKNKKGKKLIMRKAGQDHFNANESGNKTRFKRSDKQTAKSNVRNLKQLIPHK